MVRVDLGGLGAYAAAFLRGRIGSREYRYQCRLARRYVGYGGRYLHLRGAVLFWPRPRQRLFQYRLTWSARRATTEDLTTLLDTENWRCRLAASWLIAAGRRADLRDRIAQDLLGDTPCGYSWDYCTALARLGTHQDAVLLRRYLEQALVLPRPPEEEAEWHCHRQAMGALVYLDNLLGTSHAQALLAPGGLWEQWSGEDHACSLDEDHELITQLVAFAAGKKPLIKV